MIYLLEDNPQRAAAFHSAAATIAPGVAVRVWRSAPKMMEDLYEGLQHASLISLDHDLVQLPGDADDPGCGYDVVQFLAQLLPCCPIIVHTSNAERGGWMMAELARTQWRHERVYPFDDTWIATDWARCASRLLKDSMSAGVFP